jgi:hypothetical protein
MPRITFRPGQIDKPREPARPLSPKVVATSIGKEDAYTTGGRKIG